MYLAKCEKIVEGMIYKGVKGNGELKNSLSEMIKNPEKFVVTSDNNEFQIIVKKMNKGLIELLRQARDSR